VFPATREHDQLRGAALADPVDAADFGSRNNQARARVRSSSAATSPLSGARSHAVTSSRVIRSRSVGSRIVSQPLVRRPRSTGTALAFDYGTLADARWDVRLGWLERTGAASHFRGAGGIVSCTLGGPAGGRRCE
jgi:hypothetical protein